MAFSTRKGLKAMAAAAAVGAALLVPTRQASAAPEAAQAGATVVKANAEFIFINAADRERNRIFINPIGNTVSVLDTQATVTAGVGCTARSDGSVTCPAGNRTILVETGDQQDGVFQQTGLRASIDVGSGSDEVFAIDATNRQTIDGGDGHDNLLSGSGDDFLRGGPGRDLLSGGAGDDILDVVDGFPNDSAQGQDGRDNCPSDAGDQRLQCES